MQTQFVESAREYARYWTAKEQYFVRGLESDDPRQRLTALQQAGGYFKVSRSFGLSYDVGIGLPRLAPALAVLDSIASSPPTNETLGATIRILRRELGKPYGGKDVLSAASKFLWLRYRDVAVIHDSQARVALGAAYGDYDGYLALWRAEYARHSQRIREACADIAGALLAVAAEDWFQRRVFDIYLWRAGAAA